MDEICGLLSSLQAGSYELDVYSIRQLYTFQNRARYSYESSEKRKTLIPCSAFSFPDKSAFLLCKSFPSTTRDCVSCLTDFTSSSQDVVMRLLTVLCASAFQVVNFDVWRHPLSRACRNHLNYLSHK